MREINKTAGEGQTEILVFRSLFPLFSPVQKLLRQAIHGEEGGNAGDGTKAGPVLGRDWPGTPAAWETGRSGSDRKPGREIAARHAALPCGDHVAGETEIFAQEPTVVGRFHGQAVLQRGVLARTSAEIDRASSGIRASGCGGANPVVSISGM